MGAGKESCSSSKNKMLLLLLLLQATVKAQGGAGGGGQSFESNPSPGCGSPLPAIPNPGLSHNLPFYVDDPIQGLVSRSYRLHVPKHWPLDNKRPLPLLLDFHGWTQHAAGHEKDGHNFFAVADEDEFGGFLVVSPEGMSDVGEPPYGHGWGSWNVSQSKGPLGDICETDRDNWEGTVCYNSCPSCNTSNSCEWTSCYDDVAYTFALLDKVTSEYCVEQNSIHQSGISNGAMFSYIIATKTDRFASIGPVAGAPNLGYLEVPNYPISVIDFHGTEDGTIPYDVNSPECVGEGPQGTIIAFDGYYYYPKATVIARYAEELGCLPAVPWPTFMDGVQGFSCIIHAGCLGGGEVVACNAKYGHDYPFAPDRYIESARLMWSFMKSHPKQTIT